MFYFLFVIFVSISSIGLCASGAAEEGEAAQADASKTLPLKRIRATEKGPWFYAPGPNAWMAARENGTATVIKWSKSMFGKNADHIRAQRRQTIKNMRQVVIEMDNPEPLNLIPHISHQMWITKGKQVPDTHIEATIQRCLMLGKHWRHILWVMDAEVLAPSIAALKEELPFLEVRQVDDYYLRKGETEKSHPGKVHMYGRPIFDYLYEENVFVVTTDVLRKNVVYRSSPEDVGGGLYSDMGISLSVNITPLLDHAHAAFLSQPSSNIFDMTLSAYSTGLSALKDSLFLLDNLDAHPCIGDGKYEQLGVVGSFAFHTYFAQECGKLRTVPLLQGLHWSNMHFNSYGASRPELGNVNFFEVIKEMRIQDIART